LIRAAPASQRAPRFTAHRLSVDHGIAEHVHRVGLQRGRTRQQAGAEFDDEHHQVDRQHQHQYTPLRIAAGDGG